MTVLRFWTPFCELKCRNTNRHPKTVLLNNTLQVSDRPDPPRFPSFSQVGTDSLVLEWQNPSWDGGSAITNYLIEKQELPMTAWTRAGHTRFNLFPVTGLTPGSEFKFRVFAENVHGRSDASDESSTVQTKGVTSKKQPRTKYESKANITLNMYS